ncbi:nitrilase and fragile histidine triad fusion protein NitFhit-like [Lineus longissimus]|uniref:nitrilase and fragile histidine triad fusion protein NitFhit-like n=1 Tax=Lineus longissimus TaxID=88925 RepID=UPI002B4D3210
MTLTRGFAAIVKTLGWRLGGYTRVASFAGRQNRLFYTAGGEGPMSREVNVKQSPLVAVCQMTATSNKQENFSVCKQLIEKAKARGAQMVFLPECFDFVSESRPQALEFSETLSGPLITSYQELAKKHDIWLSLGGFHEKGPEDEPCRLFNTHLVINNEGNISATYNKTHLFDLHIKGTIRLSESDFTVPGSQVAPPVATPVGKVGLGVCYDMRFPEFSVALTQQGAEVLTYPSAFTVPTGMAHWHAILRSRAIENQCYVIAAAQVGRHNEKRQSYGHALVIDPWGCVVAECQNGTDIACTEIDLGYLNKIRQDMPMDKHRRHDIYGHIETRSNVPIDSEASYQFGQFSIRSDQVFHRSNLSIAFVNIKPVVPGHVLVSPIRVVEKFADLTPSEVSDLFNCVKRVTKVIEEVHGATSSSVAIQDGPDAGQTVAHVHVHILPRKAGDFKEDEVYSKLQDHDKNLQEDMKQGNIRTEEEMAEESAGLRRFFSC